MTNTKIKITILVILLIIFILTAVLALTETIKSFEISVYNLFAKLISPPFTEVVKIIAFAGSFWFLFVCAALLLIIPFTRIKYGCAAAVSALLSAGLNPLLKNIFRRVRPDNLLWLVSETGYSFPSGHAQSCTAFFIAAAMLILCNVKNIKIKIPLFIACILIPFLVGLSRIYLGVHYFGDVLAGWILGTAIALAVEIFYNIITEKLVNKEKK